MKIPLIVFKAAAWSPMILAASVLLVANVALAQYGGPAPSMDELMALEKQASEAVDKGDKPFFDRLLSDRFVMRQGRNRLDKAAALNHLAGVKCDTEIRELDEPTLTRIDADTYVLIYRKHWKGKCSAAGAAAESFDERVRWVTVWIRSGGKWQAAFHGGNMIVDPKDAPKAFPAAKPESKSSDATTIRLAALENSLWEAWRTHDRPKIEAVTADSVAFVDIFGNAYAERKEIIDAWSSNICKVTSVAVTDAIAFSLSPTVKLLTHTGTANGTCYGAKIGPIYGNSLYIKNGKGWKLAFTMNMPAN